MGVEKQCVARGGKIIIFRRGGGINIVFGSKYRPLQDWYSLFTSYRAMSKQLSSLMCTYTVDTRHQVLKIGTGTDREVVTRQGNGTRNTGHKHGTQT
jgi:hypothetical protein